MGVVHLCVCIWKNNCEFTPNTAVEFSSWVWVFKEADIFQGPPCQLLLFLTSDKYAFAKTIGPRNAKQFACLARVSSTSFPPAAVALYGVNLRGHFAGRCVFKWVWQNTANCFLCHPLRCKSHRVCRSLRGCELSHGAVAAFLSGSLFTGCIKTSLALWEQGTKAS